MSESSLLASNANAWTDYLVFIGITLIAIVYLYRKLWLKRGSCGSCSQEKSCCSGCAPEASSDDKPETRDH